MLKNFLKYMLGEIVIILFLAFCKIGCWINYLSYKIKGERNDVE